MKLTSNNIFSSKIYSPRIWDPERNFVIQWHITPKCSGSCKFCYMFDSPGYKKEVEEELNKEQCLSIVDKISNYLEDKNLKGNFLLTGGDPILKDGFWDILEMLQIKKMKTIILGNAKLLNEENVSKMSLLGVDHYQMSIDGNEEIHNYFRGEGSYAETISKVGLLRKYNITSSFSYTISSLNCGEAPALILRAPMDKIFAIRYSRLVPIGRGEKYSKDLVSPEQYREALIKMYSNLSKIFLENNYPISFLSCDPLRTIPLLEMPQFMPNYFRSIVFTKKGCRKNLMTILPHGEVYVCRRLNIPIGNILEESMEELRSHSLVRKLEDPLSFKECLDCKYFKYCGGGCPSVTYAVKGDPFRKDPQCWVKS